jgi:hypothetical protein
MVTTFMSAAKKMLKTCCIFCALVWSSESTAERDVPNLRAWIGSFLSEEGLAAAGKFPLSLVIVEYLPKKSDLFPKLVSMNRKRFNQISFIQTPELTSLYWDYKLNKSIIPKKPDAAAFRSMIKFDSLLIAPPKGFWTFGRYDSARFDKLIEGPGVDVTDIEKTVDWIFSNLGWDAVVLDRKGNYVLSGGVASSFSTEGLMALAIADSVSTMALKRTRRKKGLGLLRLVDQYGPYGLFEILFMGNSEKLISTGTKLIIER